MSNKLGAKSMKRAPSTSKKKGSSGTPDTNTPTASGASIGIDKPTQESTIDDVLVGDEVDALRIKEEDLVKVHPPKPPSAGRPIQHKRKIFVKKSQPPDLSHHREKEVAVLHPLPPGTTVTATRTIGSVEGGPRFDQQGMFLSHSVLGPARDFASELKSRQMVGSVSALVKPPPVVLPDVKKEARAGAMSYEKTITPREKNSLKFWDESMKQRKTQQQHISAKVDSPPERLLMNHGDTFRSVQEERTLIDRTMPSVSYGKGYRVGSEFWSQHVQIGSQDTGIHTTLTCTEQGLPPELEFVGVPTVVAKEKGVASDLQRNAPSHYTWDRSSYLSTLKEQLSGPLTDMHRPEVSELLVIGRAPGDDVIQRTDSLDSLGESASSDSDDVPVGVMDLQAVISCQPIIGPALLVNGKLLTWDGPPLPAVPERLPQTPSRATQSESVLNVARSQDSTRSLREVDAKRVTVHRNPIGFRVCLESETGVRVTSHVELENCGTAAVYYSWQPLPKPNPLGTIQAGETQRFYFDTKGGVLLPGQRLEFPFIFKSPNAGVFTETWLFQTGPVLCRGRQVVFTLRGIAFQEDLNKHKREELESELKHRMAEVAAERLINKIVDTIRTPPHTPEPTKTVTMEEHVFKEHNPDLYYHHGVVQKLKTLYDSILRPELLADQLTVEPSTRSDKSGISKNDKGGGKGKEKTSGKDKKGGKLKDELIKEETVVHSQEEGAVPTVPDWDLSITSLREVVLGVEEVAVMESKLKELSSLVGLLSFPPPKQIKKSNYNIVYEAMCEAVDQIYDVSTSLCQAMGLPVREFSQKEEGGNGDRGGEADGQAPSQPASPAHVKDKKGGKDSKKAKPGKDSLRSGSSKNKPVSQKKSKPSISSKDSDAIKQMASEASADIDPVIKKKYSDNFHSLVNEILGAAADKIELLLPQN